MMAQATSGTPQAGKGQNLCMALCYVVTPVKFLEVDTCWQEAFCEAARRRYHG
jgi:hypothetical protein